MRAVACAVLSASAVTAKSMRSPPSQLSPAHGASVSQRVLRLCRLAIDENRKIALLVFYEEIEVLLVDLWFFFKDETSFEFLCILPDELASVAFGLREQILKSFIRFGDRFVADLTKCRVELRFFFAKSCRRFSRKASCVWLTDRGHDRKSC